MNCYSAVFRKRRMAEILYCDVQSFSYLLNLRGFGFLAGHIQKLLHCSAKATSHFREVVQYFKLEVVISM